MKRQKPIRRPLLLVTAACLLGLGCDAQTERNQADAAKREVSATVRESNEDVAKAKAKAADDVRKAEEKALTDVSEAKNKAAKEEHEAQAAVDDEYTPYEKKLRTTSDDIAARQAELKIKSEQLKDDAKKKNDAAVAELERQRLILKGELDKLRATAKKDWEIAKTRIDKAVESAKKALKAN